MTKKHLLSVALATFCALSGFYASAQTAQVKDVRQTYLWDVTLSMQGKAAGCPDIWDEVKNAIIQDIQQISDDRTEIVVVPFQHKALDEWRENATASGKAALISKIKAYKIPLFEFNGRKTTMTCLYEPLQYVVDKVLSPEKVDILKLMTDGIPDEHAKEYEQLLGRWCQIAQQKDAYGFYIMLTEQAKQGQAVLEKINPCHFDVVDVTELGGTNVSIQMLTPQPTVAFNMREDYGKEITLKFAHSGSTTFQKGYMVHVTSFENEYIRVDSVAELKSDYTVTVKAEYLMSQEQMMQSLSTKFNEKAFLQTEPADGMDQLPYATTRILQNPTAFEMINKPEKTVKFHVL